MRVKRLLLTVLLTAVLVWLTLFFMTMAVHPTSGSGEGNVFTTPAQPP